MDAVLRFVEAGLGVAVVPSMVLPGRPRLRATALSTPGIRRTDVPPANAARAFRSTLLAYLAEANLPAGVGRLR